MVFTFNSLANHMAISTEEWQKLRDQFDNRYWMDSAALHTKHNMLDVKFLIAPTYRTGQPVSGKTKGPKPVANRYSVLIRCSNINTVIKDYEAFRRARETEKKNLIWQILNTCPVKLFSDDPSFLYQGMWVDCENYGVALFKLDPVIAAKDKGIWRRRHNAPSFRVTKHIGQIAIASSRSQDTVARAIAIYLDNHPERYVESINDLELEDQSKIRLLENIELMERQVSKLRLTEQKLGELLTQLDLDVNTEIDQDLADRLKKAVGVNKVQNIIKNKSGLLNKAQASFGSESVVRQHLEILGFPKFYENFRDSFGTEGETYWLTACFLLSLAAENEGNFRDKLTELYNYVETTTIDKSINLSDVISRYGSIVRKYFDSHSSMLPSDFKMDGGVVYSIIRRAYNISGTGETTLNRKVVGKGEFLLAMLFGGRKEAGTTGIVLANGLRIKIKSGVGRLDSARVKAAVLTDKNLQDCELEAIRKVLNPNATKDDLYLISDREAEKAKQEYQTEVQKAEARGEEPPTNTDDLEGVTDDVEFGLLEEAVAKAGTRIQSGVLDFGQRSFEKNWCAVNEILTDEGVGYKEREDFFREYIQLCYKIRWSDVVDIATNYFRARIDNLAAGAASLSKSNAPKTAKEMMAVVADLDFAAYATVNYLEEHQTGDNHDSILFTKNDSDVNIKLLAISVAGLTGAGADFDINRSRVINHVRKNNLKVHKFGRDSMSSNIGLEIK